MDWKSVIEGEREKQGEERWNKIENGKYNQWYKWIKKEGIPEYLKK